MDKPPFFTVVIPAYNEESVLPETLNHIKAAADRYGQTSSDPVEVILVDNGSDDSTARIGAGSGAKVVREEKRQIARARNCGAGIARGEMLLFCDADTHIHPGTLTRIRNLAEDPRLIGGGIPFIPDEAGWLYRLGLLGWDIISRVFRISGGTLFCRRNVFNAMGGFPERFYIGEEVVLQFKMKFHALRHGGRTVLLSGCNAVTSMRKIRDHGFWKYMWAVFRCLLFPWLALRREYCPLWYEVRTRGR